MDYVGDIIIIDHGKFNNFVKERMQQDLNMVTNGIA